MPPRTSSPPPLNNDKSSPGASSTGYSLQSPSLQSEEGLRQRSPQVDDFFSEKDMAAMIPPQSQLPSSDVKPYVGLRSKFSLAWVNYPVVSLLFIILRIFSASRSVGPVVEKVKEKARQSCDALELATSTITSLPHFMASGFNRTTITSVNLAIRGIARIIDLLLFAMEAIIVWLIHVFGSTYKCLLEFALRASTGTLSESVRVLGNFTQVQLNGIKTQLDSQIAGVNSALEEVRKAADGIGNVLNGGIKIPTITISTEPLGNFQLPTTNIVDGLDSLGNVPTLSEIENKLSDLVSIPFNDLRGSVKSIMSDSNLRFNESLLPVPPKNQITFCDDNLDLRVLDDISRDLIKAAYIGMGVLFAVILLMIAANAVVVWFSHIRYKLHVNKVNRIFKSLSTVRSEKEAVVEVLKISEHPFFSKWFIRWSSHFKSPENKILFRWFCDYAFHKPALVCLIIGLSGLLGVYLEVLVLNTVKQNYKQPIDNAISTFGNAVENLINSQLSSTSSKFASDSNGVIGTFENGLNQDLFVWVNITTTTLNNTLNTAVDEITAFVQNTFKGVPVLLPIVEQLVNCLIVVKIEGIQAGLTFIKENAFIGLPRVNDTVLLIGKGSMNEIVGQATNKLVGPNNGEIGGEIGKIFDVYENNLLSDLPLYWTLIIIWFIVILMGITRILWFKYQKRKHNKLNSNSPVVQPNDLSQYGKSIASEDEKKHTKFRSKLINIKKHRSSQKSAVNPTFPRNYNHQSQDHQVDMHENNNSLAQQNVINPFYPPQLVDDDYQEDTYDNTENNEDNPFADNKYRFKPPLPPKPTPLERHDIRNNNNNL